MERSRINIAVILAIVAAAAAWMSYRPETSWLFTSTTNSIPLVQTVLGGDASEKETWDVRHHLGGNGPWIPKTDDVVEGGTDVPAGCRVDQVHMMARHAERYPTISSGIRMLEVYHHLKLNTAHLNTSLVFAKDWDFFTGRPATDFENLITTGPYAGSLSAFTTGTKLRSRYPHLLDHALANNQTRFWASDSKRVVDTAEYFATGFWGLEWERSAKLEIVAEDRGRGADTLAPGLGCRRYADKGDPDGHDLGNRMLARWKSVYLPPIVVRLREESPGLELSNEEVFVMQEICGFETMVKGQSPWCGVFSHEEWRQYEYARDLLHFYRSGPGNKYSAAMGLGFLEATTELLRNGSEVGSLFLSFVHDSDILHLLTALDLFPLNTSNTTNSSSSSDQMPPTQIPAHYPFHTSTLVPMSATLLLERIACPLPPHCWSHTPLYPHMVYCDPPEEDVFVRVVVNDGVVALEGCEEGPGESCGIEGWRGRVEGMRGKVSGWVEVCGGNGDGGVGFLHQ